MVVHDLHVVGIAVCPLEADAPLVVDANAELADSVVLQFLKVVGAWDFQVVKALRRIEHAELSPRCVLDVRRQIRRDLPTVHPFRFGVAEGADHS